MNADHESHLVEQARAGDDAAVNELCALARPYLVKLFFSRWHFSEEAEDLAQEALIRLMIALRRGYEIRRFNGFVYLCGKRALIDYMKSCQVRYGPSVRTTQKGKTHEIIVGSLTERDAVTTTVEEKLIAAIVTEKALADVNPMAAAAL
ncbi:MAG TPA: sigma factor, partial [Candidatus Angelobacter sp.]|nr:sigma factor [Candidatus Angelobacter sp.]